MALNGKITVVTGAALGIGKEITEILLQNGAKVKFVFRYSTKPNILCVCNFVGTSVYLLCILAGLQVNYKQRANMFDRLIIN